MTRSRKNSIVQNIAAHATNAQLSPVYTDDLLECLQKFQPSAEWNISSTAENDINGDLKYKHYLDHLQQLDEKNGYYMTLRDRTTSIAADLNWIIDKFQAISAETSKFKESTDAVSKKLEETGKLAL